MAEGMLANQKPNVYEDSQVLDDTTKGEFGLPETATPNEVLSLVAKAICPIGSVFWLASQTIPAGFLLADGRAVSRTEYANLFRVIGTTFGTGDGSTTFNLPNLQAAFIRGAGVKDNYSATFGKTQDATRFKYDPNGSLNYMYGPINMDGVIVAESNTTAKYGSASGSGRITNYGKVRPYNIALTPIIKY